MSIEGLNEFKTACYLGLKALLKLDCLKKTQNKQNLWGKNSYWQYISIFYWKTKQKID